MAAFSSHLIKPSRDVATRAVAILLSCIIGCVSNNRATAADPFPDYDLEMFEDVDFETNPQAPKFPDGLKELWERALARDDAPLRRLAADSFAIAHAKGLDGLEQVLPRLVELLNQPNQNVDVVRAIASTLVAFDQRDQDERLAELALQYGPSFGSFIERALITWKSPAMKQTWLDRVNEGAADRAAMVLAIEGLGSLEVKEATDPLKKIVSNQSAPVRLRLDAARALGRIAPDDSVAFAQRCNDLKTIPPQLAELLAVALLSRQDDEATVTLLTTIASSPDPAAQGQALQRLLEVKPEVVASMAGDLFSSSDAKVRRCAAESLFIRPSPQRVELLAQFLNDENWNLRRYAAKAMQGLAEENDLRDVVIEHAEPWLSGEQWRGCEMAVSLLTRLNHRSITPLLAELIAHRRGDVRVAAAWGLSKMPDDTLLPQILDHAQGVFAGFRANQLDSTMRGMTRHMAFLLITMGKARYEPAVPLMEAYLPKQPQLGLMPRPAAAWGLGLIYEGNPQDRIVAMMVQRLTDDALIPAMESEEMKLMCTVSLVRMGDKAASLPAFRNRAERKWGLVAIAANWAIEQLTGEPAPPIETVYRKSDEWFLTPIEDPTITLD